MTLDLRSQDLAVLEQLFTGGDIRSISGAGNNVDNPSWGSADELFVRLSDAHYEPGSVNGVRVTGGSGNPLPNERLVSDIVSENVDPSGNSIDMPDSYGTNLLLMTFGQFFDHGLDFYARGGGTQIVNIGDIDDQLQQIADANPDLTIDTSDNILTQNVPPGYEFLIGGRAGRYTVDADGRPVADNANGTAHLNKVSSFIDQNQTYGSEPALTWLLRETARDAQGHLLRDAQGDLVKTHRLLDGSQETGPDGVARGTLATYKDILLNNGLDPDVMASAVALAQTQGGDAAAWLMLEQAGGFVDFANIGDGNGTILIGDKNDFDASPTGPGGVPNPNFSLEKLLAYYVAGDHRANENVALTSMHTVFHREHNFQAEQIAAQHPEWSADQIFETAKMITSAEYQRVVFEEFANAMTGGIPGAGDHGFGGYDAHVNATISEEFAGAMYRVGHSMINETIPYLDANGDLKDVSLIQAFLNPAMFAGDDPNHPEVSGGTASFLQGSMRVAHQQIDTVLVEAVRSQLLGLPLDLGAANIMRGRELGLSSLNEFREAIGTNGSTLEQAGQASDYVDSAEAPILSAYASWEDFGAHLRGNAAQRAELLALFKTVYRSVDDIDLWIGGLAEAPVAGSQMGSTFTWIFQEQLDRLQDGDRFYYLDHLDGTVLVEDISRQHLSDLIARNTGAAHTHWDTFKVSEERRLAADETNHDFTGAVGANGAALVLIGNARDNAITGTAGSDTLYGGDGNDTLRGGAGGIDALHGEAGNDTLTAAAGTRDALLYGQAGDDTLKGGGGDDLLEGAEGNDLLVGGAGKDLLKGGQGDDWLMPESGRDTVDGGAGVDTVDYRSSGAGIRVDLRVPDGRDFPNDAVGGDANRDRIINVENVRGSDHADTITGDSGANVIEGGEEGDALDGRDGIDTLSYEHSTGGVSVNLTTHAVSGGHARGDDIDRFENVVGSAYNDRLTGTSDANTILAASGNDFLDGAGGADILAGGLGNDRYFIDNLGDVVHEAAGRGADTVFASVDYVLGTGEAIETLRADAGASGLTLTGNELVNRLTSGAGKDTLAGLGGNDYYDVNNAGDVVHEASGGGTDTVFASVDYVLGTGEAIETLRANAGATGLSLTGNELANSIVGGNGGDHLNGGGGNDRLNGLLGNDTFVFTAGFGRDQITGFDAAPAGGQDLIDLSGLGVSAANFASLVAITQVGANTVVTLGADTITLLGISSASVDHTDFLLSI